MADRWTSRRFSLGNPRLDGADDLPRLLRRVAREASGWSDEDDA